MTLCHSSFPANYKPCTGPSLSSFADSSLWPLFSGTTVVCHISIFKGLFDVCYLRLIGFSHFLLAGRKSTRHTGSWLYCCTRTSVWPQAVKMPLKQWLTLAHPCSRISSRSVCPHTSASHMVSITNTLCIVSEICHKTDCFHLHCAIWILVFFFKWTFFCLFRFLLLWCFCLLNLYWLYIYLFFDY